MRALEPQRLWGVLWPDGDLERHDTREAAERVVALNGGAVVWCTASYTPWEELEPERCHDRCDGNAHYAYEAPTHAWVPTSTCPRGASA